jgi:transposase
MHLFALAHAPLHTYLSERIAACHERFAAAMAACARPEEPSSEPPKASTRDASPHPFHFDAHSHCFHMAGVDLTANYGAGVNTVLTVLAETGTDMSAWRSERAFGSWLGVAPNPRKSGGRVLRSATKAKAQRAATAFRLAARSLSNSKSALGAFYRRLRAPQKDQNPLLIVGSGFQQTLRLPPASSGRSVQKTQKTKLWHYKGEEGICPPPQVVR